MIPSDETTMMEDMLDLWEQIYDDYGHDISAAALCESNNCPELVNELANNQALLRRVRWLNKR